MDFHSVRVLHKKLSDLLEQSKDGRHMSLVEEKGDPTKGDTIRATYQVSNDWKKALVSTTQAVAKELNAPEASRVWSEADLSFASPSHRDLVVNPVFALAQQLLKTSSEALASAEPPPG